jgi:AraC-like DNA-binding protein
MKDIPVRQITSPDVPVSSGRFKIRDVAALLDGKDLLHHLHRHDFFFILAIEKGSGPHEIDFTPYPIYDNSVFILRPGQVHQLELKAGCMGFLAEFDPAFYSPKDSLAQQRLIRAGNKNFCEMEAGRFQKLRGLLFHMFNEYISKESGYIEAIKADLDLFFIEFIRQGKSNSDKQTNNSYTQERFETFIEKLNSNITDLKQVSDYADLLNLSAYQLNAITKTAVGKPASQLITEHVLLEAKRYLLATPNQVKDIADHLGYEDISYFIRFFKKHTGYSPEAFRKNFK